MKKKNCQWMKLWDGKWGMLSSSYPGYLYSKGIRKYLGASFDNYLVMGAKDLSAGFAPEEEIIRFGSRLAEKIKADKKIAFFWTKNLRKQTDCIDKLLEKIHKEKKLTAEHFLHAR